MSSPPDYQFLKRTRSKFRILFKNHSLPREFVFLFDALLVLITFVFSYFLRFNFVPGAIQFEMVFRQAVVVLLVYALAEYIFKSYTGLIRHTSIRDIFNLILTTTSSLILLCLMTILSRIRGWPEIFDIPISIILIHFVTINATIFIARILVKIFYEMVTMESMIRKNIVIFGAGELGSIVHNVILGDPMSDYHIIAFFDDDRKLQRKILNGVPVYTPKKLTKEFVVKHEVTGMIFSIIKIQPSKKISIYNSALELGLEVLEVPPVRNWLDGKFQMDHLKKIKVQDLLGREPIQLDMESIAQGIQDRVVLVTGAAGSIGSEIVRQLARFAPERIVLADNAETPMFQMENELEEHYGHAPVRTILADVTNQMTMERIFKNIRPEIVFHAAAYKHVPLMEENPHEAIRVNVGGTQMMTKLSMKYGVRKFVMISTDKAVNPTNVMGASKRLCEMIVQSYSMFQLETTQYVIVRFGNVLGSNGSVIPIFRKQIEEGGPVTVTHPEISRYFMTIPEACQLCLEAGFMGKGGEIFVFEMGEAVKIDDLAKQMIRLAGRVPGKEIMIEYVGLRPGEKLCEELLSDRDTTLPTYNPKVKVAIPYRFEPDKFQADIEAFLGSFQYMSDMELIGNIKRLIPEYQTNNKRFLNISSEHNTIIP